MADYYESLIDKEFVTIGKIRKAHGYKGHAKLSVDDIYEKDLSNQNFLFIEIDGYHVPYRIEEYDDQKDIIVKLKRIDSIEVLQKYHLYNIALLKDSLQHAAQQIQQEKDLDSLLGYTIIDKTEGVIGTIIRIDDFPQQKIAIVDYQDQEKLIPLHPSLIIDFDEGDKTIHMDLPIGLI